MGAAAVGACQVGPAGLEWRIELDPPSLLPRVAVVEARILGGGCSGVEVFGAELRPGATMRPVPPPLGAGRWGFAASAQDVSCVRFAYDCVEVDLPGPAVVLNQVFAVRETQICTAPRCRLGGCRLEDRDRDGFTECVAGQDPARCDCDDFTPQVLPGGPDPCGDGIDQDCDGADDLCDADCDGYPAPSLLATYAADCDDGSLGVHPNEGLEEVWFLADGDRSARGCEARPTPATAADTCVLGPDGEPMGDGVDQDCNLLRDDGMGCADPNDRDRDGVEVCGMDETPGCDPDDCNPGVSPTREEVCGNELDENGDGVVAPCDPRDTDRDGHLPVAVGGDDCDDTDPQVFLGAPENCLTPVSESCTENVSCDAFGGDADGDGYLAGVPAGVRGDCEDRPVVVVGDRMISGADIHPFAGLDPCDGIDQDCDGVVDETMPRGMTEGPDGCVRTGGGATEVRFDATGAYSEYCGGCGVTTEANEDCCQGVPTSVDQPGSCGACGHDCGPNTTCDLAGVDVGGYVYGCGCAVPFADCDGSLLGPSGGNGCESDLTSSAAHCGACGEACAEGQACVDSTCVCAPGRLDCDMVARNGCEIDGNRDVDHCGRCGVRCSVSRGSAICRDGTCRIGGCMDGWGDCRGGYADGCETPLDALGNCGACGEACVAVQHASPMCVDGGCNHGPCEVGWGDCDGDPRNGCESSLAESEHCGSCADVCGDGETCNAGGDCACGSLSRPSGPACAPGTFCAGSLRACVPV
ncbi:MAG: hypothetical protein OHK0013_04420 [Sandaracinaceae bacterium]